MNRALKGNNTYTLKSKKKKKLIKNLTLEGNSESVGGLWLSPQGHRVEITKGANSIEALQIAIKPLLQFYPEVHDRARKYYLDHGK